MKRPFGRGITPGLGDLLTIVANYLLNGMILQVAPLSLDYSKPLRHLAPAAPAATLRADDVEPNDQGGKSEKGAKTYRGHQINYFFGDQTMQIYGKFEGLPL